MKIGAKLRGAVAEPEAGDVAGDDERVGRAADGRHADGGVERVRIAVAEHPAELRVADPGGDARDLAFDRAAGEVAVGERGALARQRGAGGEGGRADECEA